MISRVRNGIAWRVKLWKRWAFLAGSFRNGLALATAYRKRRPIGRAVLWDGTVLSHPPDRLGLAETIVEIWHDQVYTGAFYRPRDGDLVIDAGANVGLFSIWLARRNPSIRVIGFEPFEENFRLLEQNRMAAGVKNFIPVQAAVGGETTTGKMECVPGRSLDHRLDSGSVAEGGFPVYSFADTLALASTARIALFKIDVEGSEYEMFEHASPSDIARVDRFAIEYHEHLKPGVVDLIRRMLLPTHLVTVVPQSESYGMLYAKLNTTGSA